MVLESADMKEENSSTQETEEQLEMKPDLRK
jgi:hypothetical protein